MGPERVQQDPFEQRLAQQPWHGQRAQEHRSGGVWATGAALSRAPYGAAFEIQISYRRQGQHRGQRVWIKFGGGGLQTHSARASGGLRAVVAGVLGYYAFGRA